MNLAFMIVVFVGLNFLAPFVVADNNENSINHSLHSYTLKKGDTLWDVANRVYGNRHYSKILMTHNNIIDEENIKAGATIKIPNLDVLVENEGINRMAKEPMELILSANTLFRDNQIILTHLRRENKNQEPLNIPQKTMTELIAAANKIETAIKMLSSFKQKDGEVPRQMLLQLNGIPVELRKLAEGSDDGYGYDIDLIHQRMIRAINNAIHWSRNNFK